MGIHENRWAGWSKRRQVLGVLGLTGHELTAARDFNPPPLRPGNAPWAGLGRGSGRSGTGRCRAPPRALAHASGLATEARAAAGPLHPLLLFAPAPPLLPRSQLLPHRRSLRPSPSCSLGPLLPALTRAPGRELVEARGRLPAPSAAEPGGSAARPAAAGGAQAERARARVGTASRRRAPSRRPFRAAAQFPDRPPSPPGSPPPLPEPGAAGDRAPAPATRR